MDNRQDTNIAVELALLVALATLWGGSYTFIKLGVATIPPITLIAARTAIAGLLLLIVMWARGVRMPPDAAIFGRSFKGLDPMAPAAGSLLAGAAALIPASLVLEQPWTSSPSLSSVLALLALAVFSTAAAIAIYFRLIQPLGSVGTTAQALLRVPIGVAICVAFLGETLSQTAWIGLACVVLGVAAMTIPGRANAVAEPS